MSTLVCVPILVQDLHSALADAEAARHSGADLVEYRIDDWFSGDGDTARTVEVIRLVSDSPLPCIVTCRSASEGGHYDGDDVERVALYERLGTATGKGEHPPRYLDFEMSDFARSANIRQKVQLAVQHPDKRSDVGSSLILSMHDFTTRPPDLLRRVADMQEQPAAAVIKVAYRARSLRDSLELLDLPSTVAKPCIALGIGEFGLMSRVLAPKFGGFLTFASLRSAAATAPGQPTIQQLLGLYRFRDITPATAVYGIVGWPVSHSLSPLVHNAGFEAVGHDGVYLPLPIAATGQPADNYLSFKATLLELIDHPTLNLRGCSVTMPHKENLFRLATENDWPCDNATLATRAGNTLTITRDKAGIQRIEVSNTDVPGLMDSLKAHIDDLTGKAAAVIGAGGVARAAAVALAGAGGRVVVFSRTRNHSDTLAESLLGAPGPRVEAGDLAAFDASGFDVLVNCTPVGMSGGPAPQDTPVPANSLRRMKPGSVVMDTVYNPVQTPLLLAAADAGLAAVSGLAMFINQAAGQFKGWTGREAPTRLFERLAREQLAHETDQT